MRKKAVILHGTKGSSQGNWFPWIAQRLREAHGFDTIVPQFPTPKGQTLAGWRRHFEDTVGPLDEHSVLIGHSVGACFALRLLEMQANPIRAAAIVAGFTGKLGLPEYDELNATFVSSPFDWEKVREHAGQILCLSGDNDPYVPFEQGATIARSLGVAHTVISAGGHLNAEYGFTTFPRLLEELQRAGVF